MSRILRALWAYRGFILASVRREFDARYKGSLLGGLWAIASPLSMIVIYAVVFGGLMRPSLPGHEGTRFAFGIYLCAGIITWGLLSEMLTRMNNVFVDNGNLIKKASFPRVCLPVIVVLSSLLNFSIVFAVYLLFLLGIGHFPGWSLLAMVPLMTLQVLFCLGLGVVLGILNVFFRDVSQFTQVALQFWFWLTPVVYTPAILPEVVRQALPFNPAYGLIAGYQSIFLDHAWPDWRLLASAMVSTVLLLVVAVRLYGRRAGELADEL
jgi:lipopolysaccharide transport system permease protein